MSTPPKSPQDNQPSRKEHPSTYVVQDRSSELELTRLEEQDHMFTQAMGGVLPEQPDLTHVRKLLDVGCGPGGWLIETARAYPEMTHLFGVDISQKMVDYANAQAKSAQLDNRVSFQTGDALRMLEFPKSHFDLVNHRFAMGYLRKWDYQKLFKEYRRVCRPGGIIRLTEASLPSSNSPALTQLFDLFLEALYNSGNFFIKAYDGVINHIAEQMQQYSIGQVQTKTHALVYGPINAEAQRAFVQDVRRVFQVGTPFIRKWTKVPEDYDTIYQQMVDETQEPTFEAKITLLTAWGKNGI